LHASKRFYSRNVHTYIQEKAMTDGHHISSDRKPCPECGSGETVRAGIHYARVKRQRYRCKSCGHIFLGEAIALPDAASAG